ncbi:PfkB domain protein [Melioribacter roseus P3M-2]|uniref:PfkB domain protein n=2 Tax=Melioribacter TaxID=1134403 RepID=I6YVL5_MELRP|nr:sugar kinase [Melioribacter roseus]AFN74323.1 PfkB domain protein [Melioribacter roseus P3M-2]AFN74607.1 PfkB domain protein [Melioribacter roseus P3M-2]
MSKKVVTFGEIMLRLSTPGYTRFVQAQNFDVTFGGGEANVAVSLSNYGFESYFVTKLPKHEIGQSAVNHLRRFGVKDDYIVRGGDRIGIYFLETGASQRASKVIYDRANSAVALMKKGEVDWKKVFENAAWFHWTGITPALGKNAQEILNEACETAKSMGVTVSCDLNFRAKMWTTEEAQAVMKPLMKYVDVCIANEEDAEKSLGLKADKTNVEAGKLDEEGYFNVAKKLKETYGFQAVSITLRESYSASRNGWSALLLDDKDCKEPYRSRRYDIDIVDRVGGGDSFASGLIYGLLTKENSKEALEFAVAASCLKHTIPGDFNLVSVDEVEKLIKSGGSGRVER